MDELKPCPFCGGKAHIWNSGYFYNGKCYKCGCTLSGNGYVTEAEAISAWNTRAERTCHSVNVNGYGFRFECSACGYVAIVHNCEVRLDEIPNYCPNCGRKVVSE